MVAVDLDDVLFDFLGYFFKWHNEQYGTNLRPEQMVYSTIWEAWGGTREEAAERVPRFFHEIDMLNISPIEGAVPALERLKDQFRLAIISARDSSTTKVTRAWIDEYFRDIFNHIVLGIGNPLAETGATTKAEVCRQLGADVLIDDQLRHARDVAEAGIPVLLFGDSASNQAASLPQDVRRVQDWAHVLSILLGED
jgi:uncharacterized HAD superfamily protein